MHNPFDMWAQTFLLVCLAKLVNVKRKAECYIIVFILCVQAIYSISWEDTLNQLYLQMKHTGYEALEGGLSAKDKQEIPSMEILICNVILYKHNILLALDL